MIFCIWFTVSIIVKAFRYKLSFKKIFIVQVQLSAFPPTSPHHPSHLHFPPLVISYLKLLLGEASCLR